MIIFKDWKLRYIGDLLARQNDNLSRVLLVEGVPDGYDWVMKVQVQLNGHRDIIPLRKMDGGVGVVLDKNQLAYAGYYSLQLMGTLSSDGVTTRHTNQLRVYIGPSLAGGGDWPEVPSEYTQFEDRLRELNQHPPVPGPNGYWMIWNTEADKYEESDFVLPSGEGGGAGYKIGSGLKLDTATNTLSVDAADAAEEDNTLPITSAAVYSTVGNIEVLLKTI